MDLPPVKVHVVEHQVETTGVFPEGVTAPAQYGPGVATVGVYLNQEQWTRMSILNVARIGKFSSDRAVREYCDKIWNIKPVHVKAD